MNDVLLYIEKLFYRLAKQLTRINDSLNNLNRFARIANHLMEVIRIWLDIDSYLAMRKHLFQPQSYVGNFIKQFV